MMKRATTDFSMLRNPAKGSSQPTMPWSSAPPAEKAESHTVAKTQQDAGDNNTGIANLILCRIHLYVYWSENFLDARIDGAMHEFVTSAELFSISVGLAVCREGTYIYLFVYLFCFILYLCLHLNTSIVTAPTGADKLTTPYFASPPHIGRTGPSLTVSERQHDEEYVR